MEPRPVFADDLLADRTALVTGGGTGLGRAIATGLAEAGAAVLIASRRAEVLAEAAAEITDQTGREVTFDVVDIRDPEAVGTLANRSPVNAPCRGPATIRLSDLLGRGSSLVASS